MLESLYQELDSLRPAKQGRVAPFLPVESGHLQIEGKQLLDFAGRDPFHQSESRRVLRSMIQSLEGNGVLTTASEAEGGLRREHLTLQRRLAEYLGADSSSMHMTFQQAVFALITNLASGRDLVLAQRGMQAPIEDACYLVDCPFKEFVVSDIPSLLSLLQQSGQQRRVFVFCESMSALDGSPAPLSALLGAARSANAMLCVDESSCVGLVGQRGSGSRELLMSDTGEGLFPSLIQFGRCSWALGCTGAYVAGPAVVIELMRARSHTIRAEEVFPLPLATALLASIDEVEAAETQRELLLKKAQRLQSGLEQLGLPVVRQSFSPSACLVFPRRAIADRFARVMRKRGILVHLERAYVPQAQYAVVSYFPKVSHDDDSLSTVLTVASEVLSRMPLAKLISSRGK